jgi:pyrimidine-specific ribonucleoside hydrolase
LKSSDSAPQFAATLIQAFIERLHVSPITLGDYGAVACVIHPELFTTEVFDVVVDTSQGPARGQTICDRRAPFLKSIEPNDLTDSASVRVVLDLDVAAVEQLWFKTIDKGWL